MIQNDEQLAFVRSQMHLVEGALQSLKAEVLPVNEERYHLYAESYVALIMKLRRQIDEYIGIDDHLRRSAEQDHSDEAAGTVRQIDLDVRNLEVDRFEPKAVEKPVEPIRPQGAA